MDGKRILNFALGDRRFGLSVSEITEISEVPEPTPVPGSPDAIAGIVEIRGRIVTLMDLARIHDIPPAAEGGRLAVQLAPPFAHLGVLVTGRIENFETGTAAFDPRTLSALEGPAETSPGTGDVRAFSTPSSPALGMTEVVPENRSHDPWDATSLEGGSALQENVEHEEALGHEIVVDGRPTYVLDLPRHVQLCASRVRERFRVIE